MSVEASNTFKFMAASFMSLAVMVSERAQQLHLHSFCLVDAFQLEVLLR